MRRLSAPCLTLCLTLLLANLPGLTPGAMAADDQPPGPPGLHTHQVTGLFQPDRVADLRELVLTLPGLELVSVDYETAEAQFRYDPDLLFPGVKSEQILERLHQLVRIPASNTFGVKARCATPREQLTRVEIPVAGLDCKACSFAAYEAVAVLDGVEQARASFHTGVVLAWIHADKIDRAALEAALVKKGVTLATP
ncbi:heavy-metal-associated domain-containing protein [Lignipirellula cremea]|uniref:HMA domain-containing protein n=1 Tax=Lignipirellula cremea TaxID=2528010 RepID=A0A518DNJ5_9BACT|nr:hypothetical protein [Lignipirellula cremea]QDU93406.1 hypothetical protein Pla8534_11860 [Lignipirellula cremea]